MNIMNSYGPAAVIVFGYIIAAYWQAKRFEDLKDMLVAKIDKLEGVVNAKIDKVEGVLSAKIDGLSVRVKALEDEIHSPLVKR
jgi:hypothetical protein